MTQHTTTKYVRDLQPGDIVLGIGNTTFTEPHTVISNNGAAVIATGGSFWPHPLVGHGLATISA